MMEAPPKNGWHRQDDVADWELYVDGKWMGYIVEDSYEACYWVDADPQRDNKGNFIDVKPVPTTLEEAKAVVLAIVRLDT